MTFIYALLFSFLAGLLIIAGGWVFSFRKQWEKRYLDFFIALGAGYILAVALLDMIPEAFGESSSVMIWVIAGFLIIHLFEHVFTPHFHFGEETHRHLVSRVVSVSALVGLMVHNFFSGVAIGSGMLIDIHIGLTIFIGTVLHKIPEGFTIASIMYVSHSRRVVSVWATVLLALSSIAGTVIIYLLDMYSGGFAQEGYVKSVALAMSAGTFIHVATTDLIPRVNELQNKWMPLIVFLGVGLFWISTLLIGHH